MIYLFHGVDDFSINVQLEELLGHLGPEDARSSNVTQFDNKEFSVESLGAAAMVIPFMGERRAIVTKGLFRSAEETTRRKRQSSRPSQNVPEGLIQLLEQIPPTTDVIFIDGQIKQGNPLLSALKEMDVDTVTVRQFPAITGADLRSWVAKRAASYGAIFEPNAIAPLIERLGVNWPNDGSTSPSPLWALDSEIAKLAIYAGTRPITTGDIESTVSDNQPGNIFMLVDAVIAMQTGKAIKEVDRLLDSGSSISYILSMIARQARMIAITHQLTHDGIPRGEWGGHLGTRSDYAIQKTSEQARKLGPESVRTLYRLILDTDIVIKTSTLPESVAITELIAKSTSLQPQASRK